MENKKMMVVWFLIVIVVILGLVYITFNKKKNSAPINQIGQEENNMENTLNDGVNITILKEGTGEVVKAGDSITVNYTGSFVDGTAFDSNIDPKFQHVEPFVFTVGIGQVIKGWDVGLMGMAVGEKRKLEIAPEFAYGETGAGGVIPPGATLVFEVELLGINK